MTSRDHQADDSGTDTRAAAGAAGRPNVLLVMFDQWPGGLLGSAGHPTIQTPTLDELARTGVRFARAYSECPVCIPARRTLMTGTSSRAHGARANRALPMPSSPTLPQCFRDSGYQTYAVGKLHVHPQRDRIGFDDVLLAEEGRTQWGVIDDYEQFLTDGGYGGQAFTHGMGNNQYVARPWHLPEQFHVTNWATQAMARQIKRRDPTRPGFFYLAYNHPHPPLAPLHTYLDLYRTIDIDSPGVGTWAEDDVNLPHALRARPAAPPPDRLVAEARRAYYALCTHIDHQLRVVIGTLREEKLLDNTIILVTSDHGEMLGEHGLWGKTLFYEPSANIPMILVGGAGDERVGNERVDDRLVGLQDVMPTLLELAGVRVPPSVEGQAMIGDHRRDTIYGEYSDTANAGRMVCDGRYKLIYYPAGNHIQLFDLETDPREYHDLATSADHRAERERLTTQLIKDLYGADEQWTNQAGHLVGLPDPGFERQPNRGLFAQRGLH